MEANKTFDINAFAKEVHENAVAHGWWEEDRNPLEVAALIHSELSEALEEYRAERPLVWHKCEATFNEKIFVCTDKPDCEIIKEDGEKTDCKLRDAKPEGIAVELIDAVIRILDYAASKGLELHQKGNSIEGISMQNFPIFIGWLHYYISIALTQTTPYDNDDEMDLLGLVICLIFKWIHMQGVDPEAIMLEKHNYNKTRPYRHGGKTC